jgi:hypothetical protein
MQEDFWESVLAWIFTSIATTFAMAWIAKSRMDRRPASDANSVQHPKSTLILGLVTLVFFAEMAALSITVGKDEDFSIWIPVIFLLFSGMGGAILADYFFARHRLSSKGIEFGKMFGQRGFVRWNDVRSVDYRSIMKWFRLRTKSGTTVRLSVMLMGLPEFAQHVLAHVPADRIAENTKWLLRDTANGDPPSILM